MKRLIAALALLAAGVFAGDSQAVSVNIAARTPRSAGKVRLGASLRPARSRTPRCTIFTAPAGRGSSRGRSRRNPASLLRATRIAGAGSVVCLLPGTYRTSQHIMLSRSGRPGRPITYRNDGGTALLQYVGGTLSGGVLQTKNGPHWGGAHDIVIDGLHIDGAKAIDGGVFVTQGSHHITVRNCVITNTGSSGISVLASDYVTITHNMIFHFGYAHGWSGGISIWNGGYYGAFGGRTAWYDRHRGFVPLGQGGLEQLLAFGRQLLTRPLSQLL